LIFTIVVVFVTGTRWLFDFIQIPSILHHDIPYTNSLWFMLQTNVEYVQTATCSTM